MDCSEHQICLSKGLTGKFDQRKELAGGRVGKAGCAVSLMEVAQMQKATATVAFVVSAL
jgi:hypothetical protein